MISPYRKLPYIREHISVTHVNILKVEPKKVSKNLFKYKISFRWQSVSCDSSDGSR